MSLVKPLYNSIAKQITCGESKQREDIEKLLLILLLTLTVITQER
jgi:hypothetical protein